jgi:peroxiredoxin
MMLRHTGRTLAVAVLLVAALGLLHYLASLPKAPAIAPETPQARRPFPVDLALPDLHGTTVRLADLRGKVVLLNIWATWCYPCRAEMPSMNALYQDYRSQGFEILAISMDVSGAQVVAPFVAEYALTFPVLLDPQDTVSTRLLGGGIPTSYVLDKRGQIVAVEVGTRDWNSARFRRLLEQLLAEEESPR